MAQSRTNLQNWANKGEQNRNINANVLSIPTSAVAEQENKWLNLIQNIVTNPATMSYRSYQQKYIDSLMDPK